MNPIQTLEPILVFSWSGELPPNTLAGLDCAGRFVDGEFQPGFICYGVPIGTDIFVRDVLREKVEEVARGADRSCEVLGQDSQALWTILRSSVAQQLDYHLSLCYPSDIRAAAEYLDGVIWRVLEFAAKTNIPQGNEGLGWECCLQVPVENRRSLSYQSWLVRQPVRMGGLGLRSLVDTSPAAFIGALEMALPFFPRDCPVLSELVGDEVGGDGARWQDLLRSGCRTGTEFAAAWDTLQTEARETCNYLGRELEGPL